MFHLKLFFYSILFDDVALQKEVQTRLYRTNQKTIILLATFTRVIGNLDD